MKYYVIIASEGGWNGSHHEWTIETYSHRPAAVAHANRLREEQEPHHLVTYDVRDIDVK